MTKINNTLLKELLRIQKFIKDFNLGKYRIIDSIGNVYSKNNNFLYKYLLKSAENLNKTPYHSLFIDWLIESEKIFPNSSELLLQNLCDLFLKERTDKKFLYKRRKAQKQDLYQILLNYVDKENIDLILTIFSVVGPDVLINLDFTANNKIQIKKENFTRFEKIFCHEELNNILFSDNLKSHRDIIFVAIDGFLERDTDLQYAYIESQQNQNKMIVVLCRGTNIPCVQNIKRNILYTKCPVLIYECPFTNEDPSKFDDLCRCLGVDSVKIEDGNPTIIQIKNKLKLLQNIVLTSSSIEFCHNREDLMNEINTLLIEKEEFKEYLKFRKKRIKSKKVDILIPKNKKNILNDVKTSLFIYNSLSKYGIIEKNNEIFPAQLLDVTEKFANEFYNKLIQINTIICFKDNKESENNYGKEKQHNSKCC